MRLSLLYNPLVMIDRLAVAINRRKRKNKLKGTPAQALGLGYIDSLELLELIKADKLNVKTIYDVGANIGTWTILAKSFFPDAAVYAFEPLPIHLQTLRSTTAQLSDTHILPYCLGNQNSAAKINVSSFSDSSSLMEATPLEFEQYNIKKQGEYETQIKKATDLILSGELQTPDVMKLDVQGYELEVLKGMGDHLNQVKFIIAEVSFKEYYHGQALFLDIANYLTQFNLQIYAFGHATPTGQELGQIDVLFKRKA